MQRTRTIRNNTAFSLELVLFIQAGNDPTKLFGTVNVSVPPHNVVEARYGDQQNRFLTGLQVLPQPDYAPQSLYAHVHKSGDGVDKWLNQNETLVLTLDHLTAMEQIVPAEGSVLANQAN